MPYSPSDITDQFGSGGANVAPNQGSRSGPSMRDLFRDLLTRVGAVESASSAATKGSSVLMNGVSPTIVATVTATSRIICTRSGFGSSTAIGELLTGNRVIGAPGSFRVSSQKADMSGVEVGDQSTFDWAVE